MRMTPFLLAGLLAASLSGCDRIKAQIDATRPPPAKAAPPSRTSADESAEAGRLKTAAGVAQRSGGILTVSDAGTAIARFENRDGECTGATPCSRWYYTGSLSLTDPVTGKPADYASVQLVTYVSDTGWGSREIYVVDRDGRIYDLGSGEPAAKVSPDGRFVAGHLYDGNQNGILVLDWSRPEKALYDIDTLFIADGWSDATHIAAEEIPNEGLIQATVSRQPDSGWVLHETGFYDESLLDYSQDKGYTIKPGARPDRTHLDKDRTAVRRDTDADMAKAAALGYSQVTAR